MHQTKRSSTSFVGHGPATLHSGGSSEVSPMDNGLPARPEFAAPRCACGLAYLDFLRPLLVGVDDAGLVLPRDGHDGFVVRRWRDSAPGDLWVLVRCDVPDVHLTRVAPARDERGVRRVARAALQADVRHYHALLLQRRNNKGNAISRGSEVRRANATQSTRTQCKAMQVKRNVSKSSTRLHRCRSLSLSCLCLLTVCKLLSFALVSPAAAAACEVCEVDPPRFQTARAPGASHQPDMSWRPKDATMP